MTPEDDRTEPPLTGDEVPLLTGFLDHQRQTLAWKCAGLTPQQRSRSTRGTTGDHGSSSDGSVAQ